jgi:hypothetical protein
MVSDVTKTNGTGSLLIEHIIQHPQSFSSA